MGHCVVVISTVECVMYLCLFVVVNREVLSEEMTKACSVYAQWLIDASKVTEDDKVNYHHVPRSSVIG